MEKSIIQRVYIRAKLRVKYSYLCDVDNWPVSELSLYTRYHDYTVTERDAFFSDAETRVCIEVLRVRFYEKLIRALRLSHIKFFMSSVSVTVQDFEVEPNFIEFESEAQDFLNSKTD